jgi:hypothetical protein
MGALRLPPDEWPESTNVEIYGWHVVQAPGISSAHGPNFYVWVPSSIPLGNLDDSPAEVTFAHETPGGVWLGVDDAHVEPRPYQLHSLLVWLESKR